MQTRQELILDFMKAIMATDKTVEVARTASTAEQKAYARDIYLMAAIFADKYIETM